MRIALRRILFPRFVRRPIRRMLRRPFGRLVSHFLARLVRGGKDGPGDEFDLGIGMLLGLLAAPGILNCFLLLDKYSSLLNWMRGRSQSNTLLVSIPEKHLYIALAMAVAGIVTVLKWDKILPDSQDYQNLAPLPIRARTVFLANALALLIAVAVIAVDVNVIPGILFPLFVSASGHLPPAVSLQFVGIHLIVVILASIFAICAVLAFLGTLAAVLPRAIFQACSSWIRGMLLLAFLVMLSTGFGSTALVRKLERFPDSVLQWLPSLWFLGLYQSLQHVATPALAKVSGYALSGTVTAFLAMAAAYGVSYRRRFAAVLEGGRKPAARLFAAGLMVLDLFAYRAAGFRRACHRFAVRALLRSETHRLVLAVSIGMAGLLALQSSTVEAASLTGAYLLILGLRVAFDLPAALPANWIFRSTLNPNENETAGIARRVMLSFLTPLVLVPSLAAAWWQWGLAAAVVHAFYVLGLSWSLMEVLLAGYRKLPLTSAMPGFRDNSLMLLLLQLVGFLAFTRLGARIEQWMFGMPLRFLLVPLVMLAAGYWNRQRIAEARKAGELEEGLVFENAPVRTVEQLHLSDVI